MNSASQIIHELMEISVADSANVAGVGVSFRVS